MKPFKSKTRGVLEKVDIMAMLDYSKYRAKNNHPIDANLNTQYFAYVMAERLRNTCFGNTTRAIAMQFAMKTNMENRVYWGGLEDFYDWTGWKRATVTEHLGYLEESKVMVGVYTNSKLFQKKVRQNYLMYLPPENMLTCADWDEHSSGDYHRKNYLKFINKKTENGITISPEIAPDEFEMSADGEGFLYVDGEPWLLKPTAHPYEGAM
jgi:hypothetical protein